MSTFILSVLSTIVLSAIAEYSLNFKDPSSSLTYTYDSPVDFTNATIQFKLNLDLQYYSSEDNLMEGTFFPISILSIKSKTDDASIFDHLSMELMGAGTETNPPPLMIILSSPVSSGNVDSISYCLMMSLHDYTNKVISISKTGPSFTFSIEGYDHANIYCQMSANVGVGETGRMEMSTVKIGANFMGCTSLLSFPRVDLLNPDECGFPLDYITGDVTYFEGTCEDICDGTCEATIPDAECPSSIPWASSTPKYSSPPEVELKLTHATMNPAKRLAKGKVSNPSRLVDGKLSTFAQLADRGYMKVYLEHSATISRVKIYSPAEHTRQNTIQGAVIVIGGSRDNSQTVCGTASEFEVISLNGIKELYEIRCSSGLRAVGSYVMVRSASRYMKIASIQVYGTATHEGRPPKPVDDLVVSSGKYNETDITISWSLQTNKDGNHVITGITATAALLDAEPFHTQSLYADATTATFHLMEGPGEYVFTVTVSNDFSEGVDTSETVRHILRETTKAPTEPTPEREPTEPKPEPTEPERKEYWVTGIGTRVTISAAIFGVAVMRNMM